VKHFAVTALLAATLAGVAMRGASAQGTTTHPAAPDTSTVDRIAAVVGSKAIMVSQVQEEVYARVSGGHEHLPDATKEPAAFAKAMSGLMKRYVDTLVAFELLYNEAIADTTIKVTDQEVEEAADQTINSAKKRFKTEADFRTDLKGELGFNSTEEWRNVLIARQRRTFEVTRYRQGLDEDKKIKEMTPTAKEIRAFYDLHKEEFGLQPAMVAFKQIVVSPAPSDSAKASAKRLADSLVDQLRNHGADFAKTAKRFSMDEQSRIQGGDLDWFPRGKMVREFEDAAFSLAPGQISNPVESPFGYHIIQVQRVRPGEAQARHILIMPVVDSAGAKAAHDRAFDIVAALQKGASFDSLQHLYHDRIEEQELTWPLDSLATTPYGPGIAGVDSGKVATPFAIAGRGGPSLRDKWAVVLITRRTPPGPFVFDDVKAYIKKTLATMLGEQDYINQLRARTYVDIREQ
jgi:parvulin-like peptidyl-prolyl isomerase